MTIEYTHRTPDGCKARIICTNRVSETYPVVALVASPLEGYGGVENIVYLTHDLCTTVTESGSSGKSYLKKYSPWDDVEVDAPVWVKQRAAGQSYVYIPRHFARYEDGVVMVWMNGLTSHSVPKGGSERDSCVVPYFEDQVFLEKPKDA